MHALVPSLVPILVCRPGLVFTEYLIVDLLGARCLRTYLLG